MYYPILQTSRYLSGPLGYGTSTILFVWLLVMFVLELFVHYDKTKCNSDAVCVKILGGFDTFFVKIFDIFILMFWTFLIFEGVRVHGLYEFKSYSKALGAALFFQIMYIVFVDLTGVLSFVSYSNSESQIGVFLKKFFGRLLSKVNISTSQTDDVLYISLPVAILLGTLINLKYIK